MKLLPVFVPIMAAILATSCKTRGTRLQSMSEENAESGSGVDLMDLSVLYPPMARYTNTDNDRLLTGNETLNASSVPQYEFWKKYLNGLEARGFWPRISEFISTDVFGQVMDVAKGKTSLPYGQPGIRFDLKGIKLKEPASEKPSSNIFSFDFSEIERWRIVSFRFSPCPFAAHIPNFDDPDNQLKETAQKKCTPEVRLVAQPIFDNSLEESTIASKLPIVPDPGGNNLVESGVAYPGRTFADYGMHLFYRLADMQEGKDLALKLLELRKRYQAQCPTTGVPMGVHPCLIAEANDFAVQNSGADSITFAADLLQVLKSHTHDLHKVAVWGSNLNQGPWGFYFGNISKGKFEWKRIPTYSTGNFDAKKDNPYNSAHAALFTRASGVQGLRPSTSEVVRPKPAERFDSIAWFLENGLRFDEVGGTLTGRAQLGRGRVDEIYSPFQEDLTVRKMYRKALPLPTSYQNKLEKYTGIFDADLSQLISKIENPKINSEVSVDCVSCHLAKTEKTNLVRGTNALETFEGLPRSSDTATWYYWSLKNGYNAPSNLSSFTHRIYQSLPRARFGEVYVMNQFSHYFRFPQVSSRVVNETAQAAAFVNENLLGLSNPMKDQCNISALNACLISLKDWQVNDFRTGFLRRGGDPVKAKLLYPDLDLLGVSECRKLHCSASSLGESNDAKIESIRKFSESSGLRADAQDLKIFEILRLNKKQNNSDRKIVEALKRDAGGTIRAFLNNQSQRILTEAEKIDYPRYQSLGNELVQWCEQRDQKEKRFNASPWKDRLAWGNGYSADMFERMNWPHAILLWSSVEPARNSSGIPLQFSIVNSFQMYPGSDFTGSGISDFNRPSLEPIAEATLFPKPGPNDTVDTAFEGSLKSYLQGSLKLKFLGSYENPQAPFSKALDDFFLAQRDNLAGKGDLNRFYKEMTVKYVDDRLMLLEESGDKFLLLNDSRYWTNYPSIPPHWSLAEYNQFLTKHYNPNVLALWGFEGSTQKRKLEEIP